MIIRPTDIHEDFGKAKLGFVQAADALGVEFDCKLMSMWRVDINGNELETFLQLAREVANE